ncbi:30S ribosomal protein S8 [Desulfolutivibrio sulfoxidireducens]|uniref:30S ribosomal protein S8 n=1 Tax=Desulfolutivibrio sulfoxidireducens TaxID=2773299 RepID=UPI00159D69E5|nr:30S ribosomal protein S8 [Desulfolutivibrio sulfoxidireducens]QLA15624.1 30S ribosomal protein S8 [Desulfolutivibrio sulfoxidireducens]QLA19230.1 30S ribosomal protein S8 [Desulfolutivibrio sulfoxidireducens]
MSVVDPIADMLARIRNAHQALHADVVMPVSKMKAAIAVILKDEGYIAGYAVDGPKLSITLKYSKGKPTISGLKKISTPGRRVYVGAKEIPDVQNGLGISILSTSRGVLAAGVAREQRLGGELLCEIW